MAASSCCSPSMSIRGNPNNPDWMGNLPSRLHNIPLNQLAIPGSHDSATSSINSNCDIAPNCPKFVSDLCKVFGKLAKKYIYNWSVTQSKDFTQQLQAGVRYFDLRIAVKKDVGYPYYCHGLFAGPVIDGLKEMSRYLTDHPKEIIFLDFNHIIGLSNEDHLNLIDQIKYIFQGKICPFLDMESLTLENLWKYNLQVIVFYHSPVVSTFPDFFPGKTVPSPWPNTCNPDTLIKALEINYEKRRDKRTFYVSQGILTPDVKYVISHLGGTLEKYCAEVIASRMVDWISSKQAFDGKTGINFCILDFVELADYIETVIELNYGKKSK